MIPARSLTLASGITRSLTLFLVLGLVVGAPRLMAAVEAPHIADAAGDANGINGQGLERTDTNGPDTRPLSIDGADLREVAFSTTYTTQKLLNPDGSVREVRHIPEALRIRVTMEGDVLPTSGPSLMIVIPTEVRRPDGNTCPSLFQGWWRGPVPGELDLQRADIRRGPGYCPGLMISTDTLFAGFDLSISGRVIIMEYPLSAPSMPGYIDNGTVIKSPLVSVQLRTNRVHVRPQFVGMTGTRSPTMAIDEAAPFPGFVVGSDVPPNVDCTATPNDPECSP